MGAAEPIGLETGDSIELRVTPDPYVTVRYAGASGDFNPIHIDRDLAREVGLPDRILHGLWTMAQVARALTDAAVRSTGDPAIGPGSLRSLSVQFRGMGVIGEEIAVQGTVTDVTEVTEVTEIPGPAAAGGHVASVKLEALQSGQRIIRNARAELRLP